MKKAKTTVECANDARKALRDFFEVSGFRPFIIKCLDFITAVIVNIESWFKKSK